MIAIFFTALAMQVPQADPQLATADVPEILAIILDSVAPAHGSLGGRSNAGRPLFVGTIETAGAFAELAPDVRASDLDSIGRPFAQGSMQHALEDDGIFVSIFDVAPAETAGEYLLNVRVRWSRLSDRAGVGSERWGYDMEMFVARIEDRWQLVRRGIARVI